MESLGYLKHNAKTIDLVCFETDYSMRIQFVSVENTDFKFHTAKIMLIQLFYSEKIS